MLILLLYQFSSCFFRYNQQAKNINSKRLNNDFISENSNIAFKAKHSTDFFDINVSDTSYFRPLKIDLTHISNNNIFIRSLQGTQYVLLLGIDTLSKKSISFESIFVNIESSEFEVYNLTLIESPISSPKGMISIFVSFLTSDFLSIPAKYISCVNISHQFNVLKENNLNDQIDEINEPHAKIILQENAKYFHSQTPNIQAIPEQPPKSDDIDKLNPQTLDIDTVFPDDEEEDNITAFYFLNSSLEHIHLYNKYIIGVFSNSTINLTANTSNEIEINTTSSNITISLIESPSYRNHIILNLFLLEKCTLAFDSSFDLITNSFVLEDIRIHNQKGLTATSLTNVPYVSFIPIETVIFVPERHNSENYCLCLKTRFESCVSNSECLLYHVNKSNYFFGTNSSFLTQIARSKAQIINIYVTYTGLNTNDYHIVALKQSSAPRKRYNFISTNKLIHTILSVHDTALDNSMPIALSFTDITKVILQAKTGVVTDLTLKNSLLTIEKSFSVMSMTTDLYSLSGQQSETITINSILTLSKQSLLYVLGLDLILSKNARMEIMEISYFPQISFASESISFSDGDSELTIRVDENGPATVTIEDSQTELVDSSVISIHSLNTNIQLELIVEFKLTNPLIISFLNAFPLPEKVQFTFKPLENEMSTLAFIMPHDDDDGPGHRYNFTNITGNLNLILLTPETVFTFIMASSRGDFFISNIPTLSLNLVDVMESVTLYEDWVNITSIYGISLTLKKNLVYRKLTLLNNASRPLILSLGKENMRNVFPIVIESTTSNTCIFFDDSFRQLSYIYMDSVKQNMLNSIIIKHHTFNVTLMTSLDAVPMVVVDDDIIGVLYVGNQNNFVIPKYNYYSFRTGPEILVNITRDDVNSSLLEINQSDFLAQKVTFYGNPFIFKARSKSLVNYSFIEAPVSIDLSQSNNKTWFEAFALNLQKSPITSISNFRVDYLRSDIYSLSMNKIQNLVVTASSSIRDDSLKEISIYKDKITLVSNDPQVSAASIKGSFWQIYYGDSHLVNISLPEGKLDQQIWLFLTGDTNKTIYLDKSWFKVANANKFTIVVENKSSYVTVQADLMNMPDIVVVDSDWEPYQYNEVLYKALYTNWLSFVIFAALVVIIVIISIVLMVVGFCRIKMKSGNYDSKQANKAMLSIPEINNSNDNEYTS